MVIDHIGGKDSWLYLLSGGDRFFVSAAEGFVFISGLVMGIVYASVMARHGLRAALLKGVKRVFTLYCLTVLLSLAFAALSFQLNLSWAPHTPAGALTDFVINIVTLHSAYYLTDVMLLYTLVIAAALPVLALMWRGYGWLALACSWALWAAWQLWPDKVQLPWAVDGGIFNFSAWQVLFITGLVIGYHRKSFEQRVAPMFALRLRLSRQALLLALSGALFGGSIALYFWLQAHTTATVFGVHLVQIFGKADLQAGRLALFLCIFVFAFLLSTFAWLPIRNALGWLLLPLGKNALSVYTLHLFVIALEAAVAPALLGAGSYPALVNTPVQAASIALIFTVLLVKTPANRLAVAALKSSKHILSTMMPSRVAHGLRRGSAPVISGVAALQRARHASFARVGIAALVLVGVAFITAGPSLAAALKAGSGDTAANASSLPVTAADALPTPTDGASKVSGEASPPDFTLFMSGTAVSGTPVPGSPPAAMPTDPPLPAYVQRKTFFSASLNRQMPYYLYLPPGYASNPDTRYPVLYMLHGISGTYNEWLGYGLLGRARDMMLAGQISEFIIVLPQGDGGYWMDHANGGPLWGTYVAKDVVNEIDGNYRTVADRDHRAIGGLSMGGYGALTLAITYPNIFSVVGADSPSLHDSATAPDFFGDQAYFNAHDPSYLYSEYPNIASTLKIWIDDGQQDGWLPIITAFHQLLQDKNIAHTWNVFPGDHSGEYWSTYVPDYLQFYSAALKGASHATPATPTPSPTRAPVQPGPGTAPNLGVEDRVPNSP